MTSLGLRRVLFEPDISRSYGVPLQVAETVCRRPKAQAGDETGALPPPTREPSGSVIPESSRSLARMR